MTGRRDDGDLAAVLIEIDREHPEAGAMIRELIVAAVRAERAQDGGGMALIVEYLRRWPDDVALDPEQIAEAQAWLASR